MQAYSRLCQVHKAGGVGESLCLNDRNEGAQQDYLEEHGIGFRMCIMRMVIDDGTFWLLTARWATACAASIHLGLPCTRLEPISKLPRAVDPI